MHRPASPRASRKRCNPQHKCTSSLTQRAVVRWSGTGRLRCSALNPCCGHGAGKLLQRTFAQECEASNGMRARPAKQPSAAQTGAPQCYVNLCSNDAISCTRTQPVNKERQKLCEPTHKDANNCTRTQPVKSVKAPPRSERPEARDDNATSAQSAHRARVTQTNRKKRDRKRRQRAQTSSAESITKRTTIVITHQNQTKKDAIAAINDERQRKHSDQEKNTQKTRTQKTRTFPHVHCTNVPWTNKRRRRTGGMATGR